MMSREMTGRHRPPWLVHVFNYLPDIIAVWIIKEQMDTEPAQRKRAFAGRMALKADQRCYTQGTCERHQDGQGSLDYHNASKNIHHKDETLCQMIKIW